MSLPKEEGFDIETFLISIPSFLDQGWCYFIQENKDNYFERVVQLVEFEGLDEHWNFSTVFMMRMMVSFIIDIREDNSKNKVRVTLSKSSSDDAAGQEATLEVAIEELDVMIMELKNYSLNGWNDLLSHQVANETHSCLSEGSVEFCGDVKVGDLSEDNCPPMTDSDAPVKEETGCPRKKDKSDDCVPEPPLSIESESTNEANDISVLASVTPLERRSFKCKQCNRSCISRKALTLHVCGEDKPLNSTEFPHEAKLQSSSSRPEDGLPTLSSTNDDCYVCKNCQQSFESSMKLAKHRYRKHGKGSLPAHCNVCQKDFATNIRLLHHTRMHHPNEEDKDVNCDQCWKTFKSRPRLIMHKWRQHGNGKNRRYDRKIDKPAEGVYAYYCDQCPKAYRYPASLRGHKKSVHSNKPKAKRKDKDKTIDESERTCKECGKVLLHRYALNRHVKSMHSPTKNYKCPVCPKTFAEGGQLNEHKQSHTGELDCPYCGKSFRWKHSLREHIRAHDGIRPYKCKECDADFIDNRALKNHTLKVHGFETEGGICKELGLEIIKTANRRKTII